MPIRVAREYLGAVQVVLRSKPAVVRECVSACFQPAHQSVDEVLQELEGTAAASASAHEQDVYGQYSWEREVERYACR